MARLFPLRSETPDREGAPRIVDLEDEDADAVFSALSSSTAREIYTRLGEEPGTPSDVAESIDSSIQNVRYHLENLEEAGLVEVVDTWYSSRGNEMSVYATTDGPLIVTNDQSRAEQLKEAISRFVGGVTILAAASLFVQFAVERFFSPAARSGQFAGGDGGNEASGGDDGADDADGDAGGGDGDAGDADGGDGDAGGMDAQSRDDGDAAGEDDVSMEMEEDDAGGDGAPEDEAVEEEAETETLDAADATDTPTETPDGATETPDGGTETVTTAADGAVDATDAFVSTIPPGLLFFLGGVLVLSIATVWWYRSYR